MKLYRTDLETIVKVYLNPDALSEIHRERELARLAFVAGVPTAIPYDVVRIEGGGYGSVFELAGMYNAYVGVGLVNPECVQAFIGIPNDICAAFWRRSLALYLVTDDEHRVDEVEAKAKIIGLTRLMRREIRRNGLSREDGRRMIEACRGNLAELLSRVDTLVF